MNMTDSAKLAGAVNGPHDPASTEKLDHDEQPKAKAFNVGRFLFRYIKASRPWGRVESDQFASTMLLGIEWLLENGVRAGLRVVLGKRTLVVFF
ncbi:hypothetical protein ABIC83_002684 [Roseateles asaccharophilus]|uniref:hypothetical protein n=1 Tax=Roseateles asaccharophilus TaxID=582607 RepID=UPI003833F90B